MGEIKSALEIAMEKAAKLERATDEERLGWKYVPEGEKLAVRHLRQDCNLEVEITRHPEEVRRYIIQGAVGTLIRNINLPYSDSAKRANKLAMDGLKAIKSDKARVENVYSKIRRIFNHYAEQGEQQRKQAYAALKADFEAKVQQAVQQQLSLGAAVKIDVERQPEFQEQWRRVRAQLDSEYLRLLDEYTRELAAIP
ncbi:MAG: hypothetical protein HY530_00705 [Chloroflexi bacterium]|nr:hypothetical protein [Chloroflexota bacterium]